MPNDLTLTTRGLPAPGGPSWADRTFQWLFVGDTLTIPKYQCGQTDFCANDSEQHAWLERHGAAWMHAVWHCVWEWNNPAARDDFMAALAPLDPSHDKLASALRKLGGPRATDRARAAKALLALDQPNLAAAVPALERTLRDEHPERRALAATLLYRWHRRTEPARLASLFRDRHPAVRTAALQQAESECRGDPHARERLPFVLERVTDSDAAVRQQALQTLEAAADALLITGRRILLLRADVGPLVGADGVDRSDALCRIADRGPSAPSHPAMKAFYRALCAAELRRANPADFAEAADRARALWDRLPLDAPEEVRLHDTRIDVLLGDGSAARRHGADFTRRIELSRSPRREFEVTIVYWVLQHTAPKGLPAEMVCREPVDPRELPAEPVRRGTKPARADETEPEDDIDENMRSFLRHLE